MKKILFILMLLMPVAGNAYDAFVIQIHNPTCMDLKCFGDETTAQKVCEMEGYSHAHIVRIGDSDAQQFRRWDGTQWIVENSSASDLNMLECW